MKIAYVGTNERAARSMRGHLETAGHACEMLVKASTIGSRLLNGLYDVLVVEWTSAGVPGNKTVTIAREHLGPQLPILAIVNPDSEQEAIDALAAGADHCMPRPVRHGELLARLIALYRRAHAPIYTSASAIEIGQYRIDANRRAAFIGDTYVRLTDREFAIAQLFFRRPNEIVSHEDVAETVREFGSPLPSHLIANHVSRLREKLHLRLGNSVRLRSVRKRGYCLDTISLS
ncbi:DNA-binding response OmpR family regulator [Burkholderia ambifaria]|nr:response regulator transcription factor [Burkholderia ambifaria]MDR6504037.1 DNA-binding response OmpR family regulator [Burkholderia ambifaria]